MSFFGHQISLLNINGYCITLIKKDGTKTLSNSCNYAAWSAEAQIFTQMLNVPFECIRFSLDWMCSQYENKNAKKLLLYFIDATTDEETFKYTTG